MIDWTTIDCTSGERKAMRARTVAEPDEEKEGHRMSNGSRDTIQNGPVISHRRAQTTFQAQTSRLSAQKMLTRASCTVVCSGGLKQGAAWRTGYAPHNATLASWEQLMESLSSIGPRA